MTLNALARQTEKDRLARLRVAAEDADREKEMERTAERIRKSVDIPTRLSYTQRERRAERERLGLRKGEWAVKKPCGTRAAYQRHRLNGTLPCDMCVTARREYEAAARLRAGMKPRVLSRCGTPGGYGRHRRKKERPCDPCRLAHNEAERERRRRKRAEAADVDG